MEKTNDQDVKNIKTETMLTPDDLKPAKKTNDRKEGVSCKEVEESVVMINPDVDSMESRG